jgi:hypothetical protein
MFRQLLISAAIAGVLALGTPTATSAQTSEAKQDMKRAGHKIKKAGEATGEAAKDTGKAVKHSAKAATHSASHKRARAVCNDGKVHHGRTRASACASHGGLRG